MKKLIRTTVALIIFILLILIFRFGGNQILNNFDLSFRPWVDTVVIITVEILANVILGLGIVILRKMFDKLQEPAKVKVILKGMCIVGIVLCIGLGLYITWATIIGSIFRCREEYIIERDKMKMVAVVESFLEVNVYYYPHKNWIVMGNNKLIYEWYGNGGYDPLDGKRTNKPKKTTYYYERDTVIGD